MRAVKAFDADYGARWPEAVAKITEHIDVLLAFSDDPAEHWIYLRTTNPRSRPSPPSGCVSGSPRNPSRGPPESRWRSSSSSPHKPARAPSTPPHLVALVRAGARSEKGKLAERPDRSGGDQQVASNADPQVLAIPRSSIRTPVSRHPYQYSC